MTASIVEALQQSDEAAPSEATDVTNEKSTTNDDEPSLAQPAVGKPISHGQIIDIWRNLKAKGHKDHSLEGLLRSSTVYVPPPLPKPEPTVEYKALMARLRREEEERSYLRMLKAPAPRETFAQRFPNAPMGLVDSFAEVNRPTKQSDIGDDDNAAEDVQKQITLILNFLLSIAGSAGALWMAARWWSTTARILLALAGSIVVAIAEVAVYSAWSWRMVEGDRQQKAIREVKEVVKTWVVGEEEAKEGYKPITIQPKSEDAKTTLRRRKDLNRPVKQAE